MKLAMEIPTKHLVEFSALTEVDFALTHMVLESKIYAEFYRDQRKSGRRVLLDNSMHERGTNSMNIGEVIEAAKLIEPSCVIAPDKLRDVQFTNEQFHLLRKDSRCRWNVGLVVQGSSNAEITSLVTQCMKWTNTLLLPYREARGAWMQHLLAAIPKTKHWPQNLHLLGCSTLGELTFWANFEKDTQWPHVTVDTAKPIKWALAGKRIDELENLRGGGLLDHSAELTIEQRLLAFYNIACLRAFMG